MAQIPVTRIRATFIALIVLAVVSVWFITSKISFKPFLNKQLSKYMYHINEWSQSKIDPPTTTPDIIIRAVYLDDRPQYGYQLSFVFLVEIRKTILNHHDWLVGCEIGNHHTTKYSVHSLNINGMVGQFVDEKPFISHAMAMINCYELQAENGSNAQLLYRRNPNELIASVESDKPVYVPSSSQKSSHHKVAACIAVIYNSPPYLADWLRYQKTIGIDHVFMLADETFTGHSLIEKEVKSGLLSVEVWKQKLKSNVQILYHSQLLAYHDCLYKARGSYDYMIFYDQDDFFVPRTNKTILYYIDNWCFKGSCSFEWIEYYPDCGMKSNSLSTNGNLTSLLVSNAYKLTHLYKCLHKLSAVVRVGIHDVQVMMQGYKSVKVPKEVAYVAHMRKGRRPQSNKC